MLISHLVVSLRVLALFNHEIVIFSLFQLLESQFLVSIPGDGSPAERHIRLIFRCPYSEWVLVRLERPIQVLMK